MDDIPEEVKNAAEYKELFNLMKRALTEGQMMPREDRARLAVLQTKLFLSDD